MKDIFAAVNEIPGQNEGIHYFVTDIIFILSHSGLIGILVILIIYAFLCKYGLNCDA